MPESSDPSRLRRTRTNHEHSPAGAHRTHWPTSSPRPRPPVPSYPRSDPRHRRWRNAALRIDERPTVHAVRADPTDDGGQRVAPACHTGHDLSDDSPALRPIYDRPVTCKNCLHNRIAHDQGRPYDPNSNQWVLPGMPTIDVFPPADEPSGDDPIS